MVRLSKPMYATLKPLDLEAGCGSSGIMMAYDPKMRAVAARFPADPRVRGWNRALRHLEKCRKFVQEQCGPVVLEPPVYAEVDDACRETRVTWQEMSMKVAMDKAVRPPDLRGGIGDARIG